MKRSCIVCGSPRDGTCLWCKRDECIAAVQAMSDDEVNAIREREVVETMKGEQGSRPFIHMIPKGERS